MDLKDSNNLYNDAYVVVIGGSNMDIGGRPYKPLVAADSNPGKIKTSLGGVGRNIAHALTKLGVKTYLITAVGDDYVGNHIMNRCEEAGIDMSHSLVIPGEPSSMYLFINDAEGDMSVAISHMEIVGNITPDYIDSKSELINGASAVVMDCNLSQETLLHVISTCEAPVYVDTVSTSHAEKIKGHLNGIDTLKPNRIEASLLTGMTIETAGDMKAAANELINQGVRRVFISAGEGGVAAADKNACYMVGGFPTEVVSTTGAGDSAAAAVVWASINDAALESKDKSAGTVINEAARPNPEASKQSLTRAAVAANAAAAIAVSSALTINPELSASRVLEIAASGSPEIKKL